MESMQFAIGQLRQWMQLNGIPDAGLTVRIEMPDVNWAVQANARLGDQMNQAPLAELWMMRGINVVFDTPAQLRALKK